MPFFCHTLLLPYLSDLSDKDIGSKGGCPVRDVNPHWVYFTIAIDLGHVWKKIFWKKSQVILTLALFSGVLEKKKVPISHSYSPNPLPERTAILFKSRLEKTRGQNSMSFSGVGEGGPNVCESQ